MNPPSPREAAGGGNNCTVTVTAIAAVVVVPLRNLASLDRLEVVLLEVLGDLLAEHGTQCVGCAEVDASPYASVDNFAENI